jgi:hypothetical protein
MVHDLQASCLTRQLSSPPPTRMPCATGVSRARTSEECGASQAGRPRRRLALCWCLARRAALDEQSVSWCFDASSFAALAVALGPQHPTTSKLDEAQPGHDQPSVCHVCANLVPTDGAMEKTTKALNLEVELARPLSILRRAWKSLGSSFGALTATVRGFEESRPPSVSQAHFLLAHARASVACGKNDTSLTFGSLVLCAGLTDN